MLCFLHCCADAGVIVTAYTDKPQGTLIIDSNGIGKFTEITLNPLVTFQNQEDEHQLSALHEKAHKHCFIANSLSCPVQII
jgi:organic hydroperoxide reductase OsmC/OhrA